MVRADAHPGRPGNGAPRLDAPGPRARRSGVGTRRRVGRRHGAGDDGARQVGRRLRRPTIASSPRRRTSAPAFAAGASGDLYHLLLPTVIAQRITSGEAVRQWAWLVRRLGEPAPGPFPGLLLPPSPERLAAMPTWWFHPLGIEVKRARALVAVARVAHRALGVGDAAAPTGRRRSSASFPASVRGRSAWCADRSSATTTPCPIGDYHFPHTVSWNLAGEPRGDDARMLELLEPYRPQRGRVLRLLGLAGRRAPAFGPQRRILPMYRW